MYLWILPSQSIKRTVEEKLEETCNIFYKELKIGNKELNQTSMFYPDHMPRKAGQVYWVTAQRHQLERFMEVRRLDNKKDLWFLVHNYCFLQSLTNLTSISSTLFCSPLPPGASEGPLNTGFSDLQGVTYHLWSNYANSGWDCEEELQWMDSEVGCAISQTPGAATHGALQGQEAGHQLWQVGQTTRAHMT